MVHRIELMIG